MVAQGAGGLVFVSNSVSSALLDFLVDPRGLVTAALNTPVGSYCSSEWFPVLFPVGGECWPLLRCRLSVTLWLILVDFPV